MIPLVALVVLGAIAWFTQREDESKEDPAKAGSSLYAEVESVTDGDTIRVRLDGESESVRYIGIDTPEMNYETGRPACFAEQATGRNRQLVRPGDEVRLVFDRERRDRYDRLLAYVYSGPDLVQADLLEGGFAKSLEVPPNTSRADFFASLEDDARRAGRGLWSSC